MGEHECCWHDTGVRTEPGHEPQRAELCCRCGEGRITKGHGPHIPAIQPAQSVLDFYATMVSK